MQATHVSVSPTLSVEILGPSEVNVGQPAKFTLAVSNLSTTAAEGLRVQIALPGDVELRSAAPEAETSESQKVLWRIDTLAPRSRRELSLEIVAHQQGAIDLASLTSVSSRTRSTVHVRRAELSLDVTAPEEVCFGDTAAFRLRVENPGDGPAENVRVATRWPEGAEVSQPEEIAVGTLAPSASATLEYAALAGVEEALVAEFHARGEGGLEAKARYSVLVRRPRLELDIRGPETTYLGRAAPYEIRVKNAGDAPADAVTLAASFPQGLEPTATPGGCVWDLQSQTLFWTHTWIEPGQEEVLAFDARALAEGRQRLRVVALGNLDLGAEMEHVTNVLTRPDLRMSVLEGHAELAVGDLVEFRLRLENRGAKDAQHVSLRAEADEGLEIVEALEGRIDEGQAHFGPLDLHAGAETTLRFRFVGHHPGDHAIRVSLESPNSPRHVACEESVFLFDSRQPAGEGEPPHAAPTPDEQARATMDDGAVV